MQLEKNVILVVIEFAGNKLENTEDSKTCLAGIHDEKTKPPLATLNRVQQSVVKISAHWMPVNSAVKTITPSRLLH